MMFLGCEEMGYKFIDPVSKKLTVARDAIFYEDKTCDGDIVEKESKVETTTIKITPALAPIACAKEPLETIEEECFISQPEGFF